MCEALAVTPSLLRNRVATRRSSPRRQASPAAGAAADAGDSEAISAVPAERLKQPPMATGR